MKRSLLALWMIAILFVLAACAPTAPADSPADSGQAEATAPAASSDSAYGEAPMLAALVAAGELPPVEERLPRAEDIYVVDVVEEIGEYGGTWRNVSQYSWAGAPRLIMYDPPVRWAPDYSAYIPGSLRSWEYNEDGTQLTLNWRQGIKWSDGEPFTTADLQFAWEDLMLNEDYTALTPPGYLRNSDGSPATVTFPDDYTMVI